MALKDEMDVSSGGGLKRSHSSPNIAKMMQDELEQEKPGLSNLPTVDRNIKPQPV